MPPHYGKFVSYLRVSTAKQGRSGLGEAAQREVVQAFLDGGRWSLVQEFVEHESGKRSDRPQLAAALACAKKAKAKLLIAKLDRLTRNTKFLLTLIDGDVDVVFCDLPQVPPGPMGRFFLTMMAAVAEFEAGLISERTRKALAQSKKQLGNPRLRGRNAANAAREIAAKGIKTNREKADKFAANIVPIIREIEARGPASLRAIAAELTRRGFRTASGGTEWNPVTVSKIKRRAMA